MMDVWWMDVLAYCKEADHRSIDSGQTELIKSIDIDEKRRLAVVDEHHY